MLNFQASIFSIKLFRSVEILKIGNFEYEPYDTELTNKIINFIKEFNEFKEDTKKWVNEVKKIDLKDNNHMSNKSKTRRLIKVKEDNSRLYRIGFNLMIETLKKTGTKTKMELKIPIIPRKHRGYAMLMSGPLFNVQ